jgi:hypothetical protein
MVDITVTRWSKFRTIVEIKSLGVPVYVKDYECDIADNPEIGVELIDFVDKNKIDYSVPIIMNDFRDVYKDRVRQLSLDEVKEFTYEYVKAKCH